MMSFERTSTDARAGTGERILRDSVKLSEAVGECNHGQEARPIRRRLVERLRQSIAAAPRRGAGLPGTVGQVTARCRNDHAASCFASSAAACGFVSSFITDFGIETIRASGPAEPGPAPQPSRTTSRRLCPGAPRYFATE